MKTKLLVLIAAIAAAMVVACTTEVVKEVVKEVVVEKEVIKEVPVEKIVVVEKEVIREVPVEKIVVVEKEVIREVPAGERERSVLNIRMSNMPARYDPYTSRSGATMSVASLIWSRLVQADPIGQRWAPDLAERWELSDDAKKVTFNLRKGATWHDGEPVTAEDVAWTFKSYLTLETLSQFAPALSVIKGSKEYQEGEASEISGIKVVDDFTIEFEMEEPNVVFIESLFVFGGIAPIPMLPEHALSGIADDAIALDPWWQETLLGSGPYKFVNFVEEQFFEMEAHDDYYFGRPQIDRLIMRIIPSTDAGQIAMQRGEIDVTMRGGYPREALQAFLIDPRFDVLLAQNNVIGAFFMNSRVEESASPEFRKGMMHALDREAIAQKFSPAGGDVRNTPLMHGWIQKPEWATMFQYDPGQAKQLVEKSGWGSGNVLEILRGEPRDQPSRDRMAVEQQMFADAGIKVEYDHAGDVANRFYFEYTYEVLASGTGVFADPGTLLSTYFHSNSRNAMGYASPEMDVLIERGVTIIDREERKKYYQDLNEMYYMKDLPMAPTFVGHSAWAKHKNFYVPAFANIGDPTKLEDVVIVPIYFGRDDNWHWHPEQWDIKEQ